MPLVWRLCYLWRAVEHLNRPDPDCMPYEFELVREAFILGYPATAQSPEVPGPADEATEVTIARIRAYSAGYVQRVVIELQIMFDGDWVDYRSSELIHQLEADFVPPPPVTFGQAFQEALRAGELPRE